MKKQQQKSSKLLAVVVAFMMILAGTLNTIFTKYQNYQSFVCDEDYNCQKCPEDASEGECIDFEQPFFQTLFTFLGETLCFIAYYMTLFYLRCKSRYSDEVSDSDLTKSELTGFRKLLFLIPTLCDIIATSLLNLGLIYTYASVYQMLRGSIVVFTGIFSVLFLKRKQHLHHWAGIILVTAGVALVGLSPILLDDDGVQEPAKNPILGDALIILAQIFAAGQYIFEEKFLSQYNVPPVQGVGQEGVFGMAILLIMIPALALTLGNSNELGNLLDIRFAGELFLQYPSIMIPSILCVFTYAMSNFFGVTIIKILSATSRSTIEALRTLSVWCFGLIVGWEKFIWLQVIGFVVLVLGTFTYNEIIIIPYVKYPTTEEEKPLLSSPTNDSEFSSGSKD